MGKKLSILAVCILAVSFSMSAQQVIPLYQGTIPNPEVNKNNEIVDSEGVVSNVTVPTLTAFLPEASMACGSAMIICPGGAYLNLAMQKEGYEVASYLAQKGIASFVLKYRTHYLGDTKAEMDRETAAVWSKVMADPENMDPSLVSPNYDTPISKSIARAHGDGLAAMEYVKSHAKDFGIDPEKVGIMGFSAGALLALNVGLDHTPASRPAFVAPIYLGRSDKVVVPEDAAPLYLVSPQNDLFTSDMTYDLYRAWTKAKKPAELHYFTGCSHGFAFRPTGTPVDGWQEGLLKFMAYTKFMEPRGAYGTPAVVRPAPPTVGEMPFDVRSDSFVSDGHKIVGTTIVPKNGAAKKPAIIFAHGYGSNRTSMYVSMGKFASMGYICYAFDFSGGGHGVESEGSTTQMSMLTEKQNVLDAIDLVCGWDDVDKDNVFLYGRSLGASVSMLAAAEVPRKVAAVVMYYPAFCLKEDGQLIFDSLDNMPSEFEVMGMKLGKKYYEDIWNLDVYTAISSYKKDVLIIHGEDDHIVPLKYAENAYRALKYAKLIVLPGVGHGFPDEIMNTTEGMVMEFLDTHKK